MLNNKAEGKRSDMEGNNGYMKIVYIQVILDNCIVLYVRCLWMKQAHSKNMELSANSFITLLLINLLFELGCFCYLYYHFLTLAVNAAVSH